jgi:hypothetical protein
VSCIAFTAVSPGVILVQTVWLTRRFSVSFKKVNGDNAHAPAACISGLRRCWRWGCPGVRTSSGGASGSPSAKPAPTVIANPEYSCAPTTLLSTTNLTGSLFRPYPFKHFQHGYVTRLNVASFKPPASPTIVPRTNYFRWELPPNLVSSLRYVT